MSKETKNIDRRNFMVRAVRASGLVAASSAASYLLYDRIGPKADFIKEAEVKINDFSAGKIAGKTISIVKGRNRIDTVNKAIDLLGGIDRFVSPGDVVLIKPNAAFATSPNLGATSNPQLVAEVVKLCYTKGKAKEVIVADNPINNPESCFRYSGIGKAASQAGAEVMFPRRSAFKSTSLQGGELIRNWPVFFEPLKRADKLIGISPVKDHTRSKASMSMKNFYGLLGGRRNLFHQNINTIIAELAMLFRPTLVILDGTEVMASNGPTGGSLTDLKRTNTMVVSCDAVAADAFGCSLLNLKPGDLPYLAKAEAAGVGVVDYKSLKPKEASIEG